MELVKILLQTMRIDLEKRMSAPRRVVKIKRRERI